MVSLKFGHTQELGEDESSSLKFSGIYNHQSKSFVETHMLMSFLFFFVLLVF